MEKENIARFSDCQAGNHVEENKENVSQQPSTTKLFQRPPFSYIALITMAIEQAPNKMLTLSEIYKFIVNRFPYYENLKTKWRNSIRHNLSLNDCFVNVKRNHTQSGRGNYWKMKEGSKDMFKHGTFRRRKERSIKSRGKSLHGTVEDTFPSSANHVNPITENNSKKSHNVRLTNDASATNSPSTQMEIAPQSYLQPTSYSVQSLVEDSSNWNSTSAHLFNQQDHQTGQNISQSASNPQMLVAGVCAEQERVPPKPALDRNLFSIKSILEKPQFSGSFNGRPTANTDNVQASVIPNPYITWEYPLNDSTLSYIANNPLFFPPQT